MQQLASASEHPDAREPLRDEGLPEDVVASCLAEIEGRTVFRAATE
jgi:hypothetical protein